MRFLPGSVTLGCLLSNRMAFPFFYLLVVLFIAITGLLFPDLVTWGKGKIVYPAERTPDNWPDVRSRRSVLPRLGTNLLFQARLQVF